MVIEAYGAMAIWERGLWVPDAVAVACVACDIPRGGPIWLLGRTRACRCGSSRARQTDLAMRLRTGLARSAAGVWLREWWRSMFIER